MTLEADGFLQGMVPNVVRAGVRLGERRVRPADIPVLLAPRDRRVAPGSATASGLYVDSDRHDLPLLCPSDRNPLLPGH